MTVSLKILLPENLALFYFSDIVTEADYSEALQIYATHPDAREGQNLLCDLRGATDGTIDMAKRVTLQPSLDRVLGAGDTPRKIIYLAPSLPLTNLIKPCIALWQPHPTVTATNATSEAQAIAMLGLTLTSLPQKVAELPS
ncbi:hypothetical protein MHM86_01200 [Thalassobius sp. Cn5-15]|nr:hypothetical protein [Thalassobius sp. Cn5-15]